MTGVAALSAVSIPGFAPAMPNTGDGAPGTGSIFDALLAALGPIVSDPSGAPAQQAAPQAMPQAIPPTPASSSDAVSAQAVLPDAVASLEAAFSASVPSLLPPEAQSDPAKAGTTLPNPILIDSSGLAPQPDGNPAPLQPRPGRSERPGAVAPASTATPDASLVALAMILPQLLPAGDVTAAPVNTSADNTTIRNVQMGAPDPVQGTQANAAPQGELSNTAAANLPADSAAQPAKTDAKAVPGQSATPFVLSQAGDAAAVLSLKTAPAPAAQKPTANSTDRRAQTDTIARASKNTASTFVTQADNAAPPTPNGDTSAPADRAPSNSNGHTEAASRASQDLAAIAAQRPDNLTAPVASNGYAPLIAANHAPIELSGIMAGNNSWASAPQSGDMPLRLALSAPGVVPNPTSMDTLALRIAAKSADGESQFQIRLDPPSLGRIEIHLNMDSQGNAQAQLSADRPQTLDALQRDSGSLERALKDAGLDLPGGLSFSLKSDGKSPAWRDSQNSGRGRSLQIDALDAANSTAAILGLTSTGQAWGSGSMGLDIRV